MILFHFVDSAFAYLVTLRCLNASSLAILSTTNNKIDAKLNNIFVV